jgi:hypothetical protein
LANELPEGSTLIILPAQDNSQRRTLELVALDLKARGHPGTTLPAEQFLAGPSGVKQFNLAL